jgi:hypothetical protein
VHLALDVPPVVRINVPPIYDLVKEFFGIFYG